MLIIIRFGKTINYTSAEYIQKHEIRQKYNEIHSKKMYICSLNPKTWTDCLTIESSGENMKSIF